MSDVNINTGGVAPLSHRLITDVLPGRQQRRNVPIFQQQKSLRYPVVPEEIWQEKETFYLLKNAPFSSPDESVAVVIADPDDDQILATAIAASADVLCTLDRHFRTPTVVSHCEQKGIAILGDFELLQRLKSPPVGVVMDLD